MQHLDEGTIHSWLDGALSADEAARVEAHLKECRECAAAVAEARGFIAASSRILTALDNAPRGVIPAAAPIRRRNWVVWRAAAAALVVAGGSLMVFRNTEREPRVLNSRYETTSSSQSGPTATTSDENTGTIAGQVSPRASGKPSGSVATGSAQPNVVAPEKGAAKTSATDAVGVSSQKAAVSSPQISDRKEALAPAFKPSAPVRERAALSGDVGGVAGNLSASAGSVVAGAPLAAVPRAAPPTVQPSSRIRMRGAQSLNAVIDSAPLKMVGTPQRIGAKVTLYEVAPGDTVTLTELTVSTLEAAVVTSAGEARVEQQGAAQKSASPPSQARADAASKATADGVTTISWRDATTGNELKLSGRMPVARLQQVRVRIERERAAAAAARKTP